MLLSMMRAVSSSMTSVLVSKTMKELGIVVYFITKTITIDEISHYQPSAWI
jgi:hypothetical protein